MSDSTGPWASFDSPPLIELALSVQFEPLGLLGVPQLGLLWMKFRDRFPLTEEQPPLPSIMERFDAKDAVQQPRVQFEVRTSPEIPRYWFKNGRGTKLIQIQRDRLAFNWRKVDSGDEYPRYEPLVREFTAIFLEFEEFLRDERLGALSLTRCEVTYVNHMKVGEGWERVGQVGDVVTFWCPTRESFPLEPETVRINATYLLPEGTGAPLGRLQVALEPAFSPAEQKPLLVMKLIARGKPMGESADGIRRFMDTGHEWINRAFVSMTSPRMHEIWGIRHGH